MSWGQLATHNQLFSNTLSVVASLTHFVSLPIIDFTISYTGIPNPYDIPIPYTYPCPIPYPSLMAYCDNNIHTLSQSQVCILAGMHTCTRTYTHIHKHIIKTYCNGLGYTHVNTHLITLTTAIHTNRQTNIHTHKHTQPHIHAHMCSHVHTHAHCNSHAHAHTKRNTHTHTHTHTH